MDDDACELLVEARSTKKTSARPPLQIYRPPGLRSDSKSSAPAGGATPTNQNSPNPPPAAGTKQTNEEKSRNEQRRGEKRNGHSEVNNNNHHSSSRPSPPPSLLAQNIPPPLGYSGKLASPPLVSPPSATSPPPSSNTSQTGCTSSTAEQQRARAASTLSDESQRSGVSSTLSSEPKEKTKQKSPPVPKKKEEKRRQLTPQEMLHAGVTLRALSLTHCVEDLDKLIASEFTDEVAGASVGQALVNHVVEVASSACRSVAKAAQLLKDAPCFPGVHRGFVLGLGTYMAERETMRQERFRAWIAVLSLCSDLFANVGDNEQGELVSLIFDAFGYLLRAPILEGVKIEELESLISTLLAIGYELERECPDRLAELKTLIRNAFIEVSEPWARKMILLMLELSASDWKLPEDANEYYFHQTSN